MLNPLRGKNEGIFTPVGENVESKSDGWKKKVNKHKVFVIRSD